MLECFEGSLMASSPTLTFLVMVGHPLRKGSVLMRHMQGHSGCRHYSYCEFNCDTLNPERETSPAIMTLGKKHGV